MKDARTIIGNFFEQKVMQLFDLTRKDRNSGGIIPDLISNDGSFLIEVKASAYDNGGVINKGQLYRFNKENYPRRFYAFAYHSLHNINKNYFEEQQLRGSLDLKSLYLFPFSIVKAHFQMSKKLTNPKHDDFVQLRENFAEEIFKGDEKAWKHLNLNFEDYKQAKPHNKINILTRGGFLERKILDSFHAESL